MKRSRFLKTCLAIGSLVSGPLNMAALAQRKNRPNTPFKVEAGGDRLGESIKLHGGDTFYCKVSTKDTDGDMYAFESTRDEKGGPPLHYHFDQDEWWYILEGEFLFQVAGKNYEAKAGDSLFGPRMVPHAFARTSQGRARLLIAFQPAGKMEAYFQAQAHGVLSKMSPEEIDTFRQEHGFKVVGPPLTYDIDERHN